MKLETPSILDLAVRLMRHPTAPYHEAAVQQEVREICAETALPVREDAFGNLYVEYNGSGKSRPLVLAAHLDHPGFEILKELVPGWLLARFRGGVPEPYFRKGIPLRLFPGNVPALLNEPGDGERLYQITCALDLPVPPRFAVWDVDTFRTTDDRVIGRACDDLIGSAAVLATILRLRDQRAPVRVFGMLSRAEEVGFHGALMAADARELPADALVISLETSRELLGTRMGDGVIVRVGDKASVFNSGATRFLAEVATELADRKSSGFSWQRALMGGGTCEATAYQQFGYTSAAVCVALGNYHNCGPGGKIAEEFVSIRDVECMVDLLVEAGLHLREFDDLAGKLDVRLKKLLKEAKDELRHRQPRHAQES